MPRSFLVLILLISVGCARGTKPDAAVAATTATAPKQPEPEQPRFEHIFLMPAEKALAEATKLLGDNGWVLKPLENPLFLLTEWKSAQLGLKMLGYQSDGDHTRYLVVGETVAPRQSIVRIFQMKRVAFSNDAEIRPDLWTGGAPQNQQFMMEQFEQSFRRRGAPVELAQRERDTAGWVELDGPVKGTRDLILERALTLRLESRPSLETLVGTLKLTRDDAFSRSPAFYLKRWKQPTQEPCERRLPGFQPLLHAGLVVLIGEQLGTREIPAAVGDLACEAALAGHGVTVGLAIPIKEQARIDKYLASPGKPADQDALLSGDFWRKQQQDGRGSRAVMDLIDRVRALRSAGRTATVVAIDTDMRGGSARDAHMAQVVLKQRAARPQDVFLVLAGNAHTRLVTGADWSDDFVPMSKVLAASVPGLQVLEAAYAQGRRWGCDLELDGTIVCDVMGITPGPQVEILPDAPVAVRMLPTMGDGFHGFIDVGTPSASLPAIALRGHEPEAAENEAATPPETPAPESTPTSDAPPAPPSGETPKAQPTTPSGPTGG
ncbi:hypothetical protein LY474_30530 [Myxococcus stipitatus]|uniref:hypothetical protein n=1 Tax=Myxococcus stipitatus TaxID=83455 RepID=UPI001F2928DF|nr:hypothetical protein [Myxococcus stipitatus]MCE9672152.1 hypothetical protein [Myxococcus stipitatus]